MFVSSLEGVQVAKSGGIRVLAVTSEQRLPIAGRTDDGGAGFCGFHAGGMVRLRRTGEDAGRYRRSLHGAFAKAANDPGVQARLGDSGLP